MERPNKLLRGHEFDRFATPDESSIPACAEETRGGAMSLQSRIESLRSRHANLETRITEEGSRPRPDVSRLAQLKVEKLRLKEEMERLRTN